ncbi:MAG: SDR family NAD(P)-dependent oxidoreductase [Nitrosomonadaceae bacterium]|nr:SDR family NAD(P)-dependent oxidoreductase [Nitrosomonadaceae bacterium]
MIALIKKPLCIVAGVGPGNGLAFCKKFLDEGYQVGILARNLERMKEYANGCEDIFPFSCDLSDPNSINEVFSQITNTLGVPKVVIYNAGSGLFGAPLETSLSDFEEAWKLNALGLLSVSKFVAPMMIKNGGGNILITGATASLRGGAKFAAFSSAKAAQRNLAQSLARSLGPEGIHVSLIIIDGVIDIPRTREMFPGKPDSFFMQPDDIADTYYNLTQQNKTAWTFEVDIRSSIEAW